jgi:hypothetical protein
VVEGDEWVNVHASHGAGRWLTVGLPDRLPIKIFFGNEVH